MFPVGHVAFVQPFGTVGDPYAGGHYHARAPSHNYTHVTAPQHTRFEVVPHRNTSVLHQSVEEDRREELDDSFVRVRYETSPRVHVTQNSSNSHGGVASSPSSPRRSAPQNGLFTPATPPSNRRPPSRGRNDSDDVVRARLAGMLRDFERQTNGREPSPPDVRLTPSRSELRVSAARGRASERDLSPPDNVREVIRVRASNSPVSTRSSASPASSRSSASPSPTSPPARIATKNVPTLPPPASPPVVRPELQIPLVRPISPSRPPPVPPPPVVTRQPSTSSRITLRRGEVAASAQGWDRMRERTRERDERERTAERAERQRETAAAVAASADTITDDTSSDTESTSSSGIDRAELCFQAGVHNIPHPGKAYFGGEDAHFVSEDGLCLGVADGVGAWAAHPQANAALFSRLLMYGVERAAKDAMTGPRLSKKPKDLLAESYTTLLDMPNVMGSSTACILSLDGPFLHSANIGDSSFRVVRLDGSGRGKLVHAGQVFQHFFNCPAQLGTGSVDAPVDAITEEVEVLPGDFVVLATDGLYDNVFDEEIIAIVENNINETPENIATAIAKRAHAAAKSQSPTPFSREAERHGKTHTGGKMDDICVLVSKLIPGREHIAGPPAPPPEDVQIFLEDYNHSFTEATLAVASPPSAKAGRRLSETTAHGNGRSADTSVVIPVRPNGTLPWPDSQHQQQMRDLQVLQQQVKLKQQQLQAQQQLLQAQAQEQRLQRDREQRDRDAHKFVVAPPTPGSRPMTPRTYGTTGGVRPGDPLNMSWAGGSGFDNPSEGMRRSGSAYGPMFGAARPAAGGEAMLREVSSRPGSAYGGLTGGTLGGRSSQPYQSEAPVRERRGSMDARIRLGQSFGSYSSGDLPAPPIPQPQLGRAARVVGPYRQQFTHGGGFMGGAARPFGMPYF